MSSLLWGSVGIYSWENFLHVKKHTGAKARVLKAKYG